jgi:hypothetical protein
MKLSSYAAFDALSGVLSIRNVPSSTEEVAIYSSRTKTWCSARGDLADRLHRPRGVQYCFWNVRDVLNTDPIFSGIFCSGRAQNTLLDPRTLKQSVLLDLCFGRSCQCDGERESIMCHSFAPNASTPRCPSNTKPHSLVTIQFVSFASSCISSYARWANPTQRSSPSSTSRST